MKILKPFRLKSVVKRSAPVASVTAVRKKRGPKPAFENSFKTCITCNKDDTDELRRLSDEIVGMGGKRILLANAFREGLVLFIRQLKSQMAKAKAGTLHAKPRSI